eukprot:519777_1
MDAVSVYNANQKSVKILRSSNEYLQKENAKYKAKLERLIEKTQRKHAIYMDNVSILETKIRELQDECDTLRDDDANTLNVLQTVSDSPYVSINDHQIQMIRSPLQSDCEHDMDAEMGCTTPLIYTNHEVKIPLRYTEDIIGELTHPPHDYRTSNQLEVPCDSSRAMLHKTYQIITEEE